MFSIVNYPEFQIAAIAITLSSIPKFLYVLFVSASPGVRGCILGSVWCEAILLVSSSAATVLYAYSILLIAF